MKVHVANGTPKKTFRTSVIVDVFRSSSAITAALSNGAEAVIPFSSIAAAVRERDHVKDRSRVVLAGERRGMTPKGFDYNISPHELSRENISGKTVLYTSSNLTRILSKLKNGSNVLVGGITNARAVAEFLRKQHDDVVIVACGTIQGTAIEDLCGAGAIVSGLADEDLTDDALAVLGLYGSPNWPELVRRGRIAKLLPDVGYAHDIDYCLSPNVASVVPCLVKGKLVHLNR